VRIKQIIGSQFLNKSQTRLPNLKSAELQ